MADALTWLADAACSTADPTLFFAKSRADHYQAVEYCFSCPVVGKCLEYRLELEAYYGVSVPGVWGGVRFVTVGPGKRAVPTSNQRYVA